MPQSTPSPNEVLLALLNGHGLEAALEGNEIIIKGQDVKWSGDTFVHPSSQFAHLQIDVSVHLPDGRTLVESYSGLGHTQEEAFGDGFHAFCNASFHVLTSAFLGGFPPIRREEWGLPQGKFIAWVGDPFVRGTPPPEAEIITAVEKGFEIVRRMPLSVGQTHWARLYYAQNKGRMVTCEFLVDNENAEDARQEMATYSWPVQEKFYSARVFFVLTPSSGS